MNKLPVVSFVVPLYNEQLGLPAFHKSLMNVVEHATDGRYEIIYVDDGSADDTDKLAVSFHKTDSRVKAIRLSRNFGKEYALAAGIRHASGHAILMLDGDGQHPIELIPEFLARWRSGAQVVIGVRRESQSDGFMKRLGSRLFYRLFNYLAEQPLLPGSTDFRLIDQDVQRAFLQLPETNRLTRGLIDWLGFRREYILFDAKQRQQGVASYSYKKLIRLAVHSVVSLTPTPLYIFGYTGIGVTLLAGLLGLSVFVEQLALGDPLHWHFTGTAMLAILILFLVGILLLSQAMLALYIASIQTQVRRRPLYVIDYQHSAGIEEHGQSA